MLKRAFHIFTYLSIAVATFFILTIASDDHFSFLQSNTANGQLVRHSNGKIPADSSSFSLHAEDEDCVDYFYDDKGTLFLTHINSSFSLYPGKLSADITITDSSIIINEKETVSYCYEMCLYDLEYEIHNLKEGIYSLKIVSPYPPDKEPLEFKIDLSELKKGGYFFKRNIYPWQS